MEDKAKREIKRGKGGLGKIGREDEREGGRR
jgi:hypothetical protein